MHIEIVFPRYVSKEPSGTGPQRIERRFWNYLKLLLDAWSEAQEMRRTAHAKFPFIHS